jgi:general secretion pathway protein F
MQYEIKALRAGGGPTVFALDAGTANDAAVQARAQGYTVIGVKPRLSWRLWLKRGKPNFPVVLFSQELLSLLDAGLSLIEALETLAEKELRSDIRQTLAKIIASLYEGHTLSYALEKSGANFPPLYIETVRASEKTGALSEVMMRYIGYQKKIDNVRSQIISALIYPVLVTSVGGLVLMFLMFYVVPRFSKIYADVGANIPYMSRMLMYWGAFMANHGWQVLAVAVVALGWLAYLLIRPASKQWIMRRLWQMPAIGARLRIYQLARFYRSLGMLLRGGMPVVPALNMVSGLLQASLRSQLAQASAYVREGRSISQSMEEYGLTTPVALRMLRVGERTGQMGEMMERIAAFYEEETARWLERFIKLFEPLLMTFVGLVIGVIVVLMYFPIFELAGSIQ